MGFCAEIITLYPEIFPGPLAYSISGRALRQNLWSLISYQLRDFAIDRHQSVDDTPAGGGAGMVMRADVLARAIDVTTAEHPRFLMSPRGRPFTQAMAHQLAEMPGAIFICGRFEGVDERVIASRNLTEISIGDYILSGGECAVLVILETVLRLLPGVMGNIESAKEESFENALLEYPHYTRPRIFEGVAIPDVLYSGNHKEIAAWRKNQSEKITKEKRPDLWANYQKKQSKT